MMLRRINNLLSVIVVLCGLYISLSPFIPQFLFWLRDTTPAAIAPYSGALAEEAGNDSPANIPDENRIVIPRLSLNQPILEGSSITTINNGGTWRRPNTVEPNESGNSVIVGHRYYGSTASTFYHLDKVTIGDSIAVYWEGAEYVYIVTDTKVVAATETSIEAPTDETQLTLYTCTPLWTATDRLVIIAKPIEQEQQQ